MIHYSIPISNSLPLAFFHTQFLCADFGNKLTCDPEGEGELNSHRLEKIHQGVLGEAEQRTGSAHRVSREFCYLFRGDRQHLDVERSAMSRAVRRPNSPISCSAPLALSKQTQLSAQDTVGNGSTVTFG